LLKSKDVVKSIEKLMEENASLKSEVEALKKKKQKEKSATGKMLTSKKATNTFGKKTSLDAGSVKDIVFQLKREIPTSVTIILSDADGKPMITLVFLMIWQQIIRRSYRKRFSKRNPRRRWWKPRFRNCRRKKS
jgi:alanyl-tRNA synthetase